MTPEAKPGGRGRGKVPYIDESLRNKSVTNFGLLVSLRAGLGIIEKEILWKYCDTK